MVKVERGRVLVNSSWQPLRGKPFHKSRIMDVPCLLRSALRRNLTVPDVEMVKVIELWAPAPTVLCEILLDTNPTIFIGAASLAAGRTRDGVI